MAAANTPPPMASGGQWLQSSGDREPQYVVDEAHIKRLLAEGWLVAADPRQPLEIARDLPPDDDEVKPVRKARK